MKMLLRGRFRTGEILGEAAVIRSSGGPDLGRSRDQRVQGRWPAGPDVRVRKAGAMAGWCAMTQKSIETLLDAARLAGLETTEGGRILAKVSRPDAKGTSYSSALVEIDEEGMLPLRRGSCSVGAVAAAEDGTTFFTAKRVGEDGEEAEDAQLWALPVRGEARELATRPGGFGGLTVAGRHLIAELEVHSQAADETEHRELSSRRKDAKVTAALHTGFPTRRWDHDL